MVGAAAFLVLAVTACGSDSGSSSSGSGSDSDDLCAFAQEMERTFNDESFANADQATFEQIEDIMTNVQERAPDEIKADVETVASTFKDVQEIFAENDYDLAKVAAAAVERCRVDGEAPGRERPRVQRRERSGEHVPGGDLRHPRDQLTATSGRSG